MTQPKHQNNRIYGNKCFEITIFFSFLQITSGYSNNNQNEINYKRKDFVVATLEYLRKVKQKKNTRILVFACSNLIIFNYIHKQ